MTHESNAARMTPREDGRLRQLALDVQVGRDGWGAELHPFYENPEGEIKPVLETPQEPPTDQVVNYLAGDRQQVSIRDALRLSDVRNALQAVTKK